VKLKEVKKKKKRDLRNLRMRGFNLNFCFDAIKFFVLMQLNLNLMKSIDYEFYRIFETK
jgi:hypothetical protein